MQLVRRFASSEPGCAHLLLAAGLAPQPHLIDKAEEVLQARQARSGARLEVQRHPVVGAIPVLPDRSSVSKHRLPILPLPLSIPTCAPYSCSQPVWMSPVAPGAESKQPPSQSCSRPTTSVPPEGMALPRPRSTDHICGGHSGQAA